MLDFRAILAGAHATSSIRVNVGVRQSLGLILPYAWKRIVAQVKSVWLIILYLLGFQTLVLGVSVADAGKVAIGIAIVVVGLALFMEGLFLGLMPLGDVIGFRLPAKAKLPVILAFGFILGCLATLAEPAVGVLKSAGSSVRAWDAPLLFALVNKHASLLVFAIGIGVGIAVLMGLLRFMFNWSLKPFLYVLVPVLCAFSLWASGNPNLAYVSGLAWDSGGITTGPVTVPLVLAIGLGICRMVGASVSGTAGFGVVTLASAVPVLTVLILGTALLPGMPDPARAEDFLAPANRARALAAFSSEDELLGYAATRGGPAALDAAFGGDANARRDFLSTISRSPERRAAAFGADPAFQRWLAVNGTAEDRALLGGAPPGDAGESPGAGLGDLIARNTLAATQAILLLMGFLMLTFVIVIRGRLPRFDEIMLGAVFAIIGMALFGMGIELGLTNLGNQVGNTLPSSFKAIEVAQEARRIPGFDPAVVQTAIVPATGGAEQQRFFFVKEGNGFVAVPYEPSRLDARTGVYDWVPRRGPLFGEEGSPAGILVVLAFAFIMGYGATLAEPALNALGVTVQEITVGTFQKRMLMQAVAVGVGIGIALGVAKIIWNIPLVWLLVPPYAVLVLVTIVSTEDFVNIGWDSAGVTTGPITVPLVVAMGLGVGAQTGAVEGFGLLATASVCPILSVLVMGLYVTWKAKRAAAAVRAE